MVNILITGSKGFIGGHLKRKLMTLQDEYFVISEFDEDSCIWKIKDSPFKVDVVFHLAGKTFSSNQFDNPAYFLDNNHKSTCEILEFCREKSAKIIFISTYLYGNAAELPTSEAALLMPQTPYAFSKYLGELMCDYYSNTYGLQCIIIRPFNVIGPGQNPYFLVPKLILQSASKSMIELESPLPRRDFIDVEDFIDLLISTIPFESSGLEIFNAGSGKSYSVEMLVEKIETILDKKLNVNYSMKCRKNEILETQADISKASELLNWQPKYDLEMSLRKMLKSQDACN